MDLTLKPEVTLQLKTQWDQIAPTYDWTPVEKKIILPVAEQLLGDITNQEALDIGCGKGFFTHFLSTLGAKAIGIDRSAEMLKFAETLANSKTTFQKLDISQIDSLGTNRFGVISAAFVLEHLDETVSIKKLYDCIYALLKPDGIFISVVPHPCFEHLHQNEDTKRKTNGNAMYFQNYLLKIDLTSSNDQGIPFFQIHKPLNYFLNPILKSPLSLKVIKEPEIPYQQYPYYLIMMAKK